MQAKVNRDIIVKESVDAPELHIDFKDWLHQAFNYLVTHHRPKILFIFDCIKVVVFVYLFLFIHVKVNA